jgi:glucose-6-phosphate 1-dehydrogenase
MVTSKQTEPTVVVIFGAGGDLAHRKLLPALYNLFLDHWLPGDFAILGLDRVQLDDESFRRRMRDGVDSFSRRGKATDADWARFAPHLSYLVADFKAADSYTHLASKLAEVEKGWPPHPNQIFYLAVAPSLIESIVGNLAKAGLVSDPDHSRVVVEKPFGHDLASACDLDLFLRGLLTEEQIYRIDHYLGKETVQNVLAFRFANSLFEPIWNRRYIDHVQITVAEQVGVEHRGGYYEHAGALRDMIQNHLLQVLCCVAMEPPVTFAADEVRTKKTDVLRAIRPLAADALDGRAVRGQYGPGRVVEHDDGTTEAKLVPGYRQEPGVDPHSRTETFAAVKLWVDNWRWQDVPFYLRTGKRLRTRVSEVVIQFQPVPHRSFPEAAVAAWLPNLLCIRIQPEEDILLRFQAKVPGPTMHLEPVHMRFSYQEAFRTATPEAYETLLMDVIRGDATLFMRADQVEAAWAVVNPILEGWAERPPREFPNYAAGTWGPAEADEMLAQDGRRWLMPTTELSEGIGH